LFAARVHAFILPSASMRAIRVSKRVFDYFPTFMPTSNQYAQRAEQHLFIRRN
jgi:hypothetical protein